MQSIMSEEMPKMQRLCYATIPIRSEQRKRQGYAGFHEHRINVQAHPLLLPQYRAEMSQIRGHLMDTSRVDEKCLDFGEQLFSWSPVTNILEVSCIGVEEMTAFQPSAESLFLSFTPFAIFFPTS